ncbi:DUF4355 domain-containing protein [Enterococcus sp. AZ103]|uniref:DUF4355 domain-containing protein n=1 Tax=Enterococcus sp. AZ103 TaxID=2774628 RepID=UPI003F24A8DE
MIKNKMMMKNFVRTISAQRLMKMNLQLFAEGDGTGDSPEGADGEAPISFASQSELDSFIDKRLSKSLETARTKWETDANKRVEEARSEAERLAALSAEEKATEEAKAKNAEDEKRLADITRRELRLEALEILAEKELPKELIETIVLTDSDACKASIEAVEQVFRSAVEDAVNKRLANSADNPAGNNGGAASTSVAEKIAKQANEQSQPKDNLWGK